MYYGRAFDLADGSIALPCEFCATPVWPGRETMHSCPGLTAALVAELEQRERDAWKEM